MTSLWPIILGSGWIVGAILVVFAVLVLRRFLDERGADARKKEDAKITRSYLRRVAGHPPEDKGKRWSASRRLVAVSHLQSLLRGGDRSRLMQIAEFDGLLTETLRRSHSVGVSNRVDAIRLMQRFGSEACIARLRQMMARDRSYRVRLEAAFALAATSALPPPRETMRVLAMLERAPNRLDMALLRASAPEYTDQLVLLLKDGLSERWHAQLVDAIGWSRNPSVAPLLEEAAKQSSSEIRCAALRAASKLGQRCVEEWVKARLSDPESEVRVQAANACVALGLTSAVDALAHLRNDEHLWVRLRAEQALEQLAPDLLAITGKAA